MNKIFIYFLCLNFMFMPVYAQIEDVLVNKTLDKSLSIGKKVKPYYKDDFALDTLDYNLKIKNPQKTIITDELVSNLKTAKTPAPKKIVKTEEIIPQVNSENTKKVVLYQYDKNYTDIPVRISNNLTTKSRLEEGENIDFITTKDVKINNVLYPKGTNVKARIETVSMNKSCGVPADLIVGNFSIKNIPLTGEIKKIGANRTFWVYPCAYAGVIFFGAGLLLLPIRGGHAKINTKETFVLQTK